MKKFIGTLCPNNLRDVNTLYPKVLMLNIIDEEGNLFRDHCYVKVTAPLQRALKSIRKGSKFAVELQAETTSYIKRGEIPSESLAVRGIKVLGRA